MNKRGDEKSIPHPFPIPVNFRPEVEIGLKSKMTAVARRHFLSSIASAMFSFKRYICKWFVHGVGVVLGLAEIPTCKGRSILSIRVGKRCPPLGIDVH